MTEGAIPTRPDNIPSTADWVAEKSEFHVRELKDGKPHGEVKAYRPDGTLAWVGIYRDGLADGPFSRYHPNGEISRRGALKADKFDGLIEAFRPSDGSPTPEIMLLNDCPAIVSKVMTQTVAGDFYPFHLFDANGREVAMDGSAIPAKPEGVDQDAMYMGGTWVHGLGIQADDRRHGLWRWWSKDGLLEMTTVYATGKMVEYEKYSGGKRIERRILSADGEVERCIYFDAESGAELDKDRDPIPPRPASLPAGASFDAWKNRWVLGAREQGGLVREGTFTWWMRGGELDKELTYDGGKVIASRDFSRQGDGLQVIAKTFRPDGSIASFRCTLDDRLHAVGIGDGDVTRYTFYDEGGAVAGTGVLDHAGVATDTWTFIENDRTYEWDASSTPSGRQRTFSSRTNIGSLVAYELLLAPPADLPLGPALPGIDRIDWADLPCCYGEEGQHFPNFLRALTSSSPTLRRRGLAAIYTETLHQGTIYPLSAATVPFVAETLASTACDHPALLEYIKDIAMAARSFEGALD